MSAKADTYGSCIKHSNLIYFKVTQMAQQVINRNPRQPWRMNKAILKNETLSYSRALSSAKVSIDKKPDFTDVSSF